MRLPPELLRGVAVACVLVLFGGCSTSSPSSRGAHTEPPVDAAVPGPEVIYSHVLEPGDVVSVTVHSRRRTVPLRTLGAMDVKADGTITMPIYGNIVVAGLTFAEFREKTLAMFEAEFVDPIVETTLDQRRNAKVYVLGAVGQPGIVPLEWPTPLLDIVLSAGGFGRDADTQKIVVIRPQSERPLDEAVSDTARVSKVDFRQLLEGAELRHDIVLQAGDIVYVPTTGIAKVSTFHEHVQKVIGPYLMIFQSVGNVFLIAEALRD